MRASQPQLEGLLVGGALGDALGLPAEGLSRARQRRWWPGELKHRLVLGRGMVSDDTEHAFMTAQAILESAGNVEHFRRSLARRLRWWLVALPAGVGLATGRSCVRLWFGVPPERSGVPSAGNGPAMRSAIIGAAFAEDPLRRREFNEASTRITHTDPRAAVAALAVAEAAAWICAGVEDGKPEEFLTSLSRLPADGEWVRLCRLLEGGLASGDSVAGFAEKLGAGHGVSGYAYHTVPTALYAWLRHRGNFRRSLTEAIQCGGDTDSVGAIVGSLAGADVGVAGIPREWLDGLTDWPLSKSALRTAALNLSTETGQPVQWFWPGVIPRNLLFLLVVLLHGFRRMLPPY